MATPHNGETHPLHSTSAGDHSHRFGFILVTNPLSLPEILVERINIKQFNQLSHV